MLPPELQAKGASPQPLVPCSAGLRRWFPPKYSGSGRGWDALSFGFATRMHLSVSSLDHHLRYASVFIVNRGLQ